MSKGSFGAISAAALLLVSAALAPAADISAKKILIKDNTDTVIFTATGDFTAEPITV